MMTRFRNGGFIFPSEHVSVGRTNPTADSLIILLEPSSLYKLGARLQIRLNAAY